MGTRAADAAADLARRDPVVRRLVERHGTPPLGRARPARDRFAVLARSIVFQQLAGKAAASIHGRLVDCLAGEVTPGSLLSTPLEQLRACGLSANKAAALLDLADKVASGAVTLERIGRLSDEEVVAQLVQVRGIGVWTAEMFLLFTLGRMDVWPVGDLGVRAGFAKAWGLTERPTPKALESLGDPFRPYRSVVAWYCWRAVDQQQ